jgi:hypothetical protein
MTALDAKGSVLLALIFWTEAVGRSRRKRKPRGPGLKSVTGQRVLSPDQICLRPPRGGHQSRQTDQSFKMKRFQTIHHDSVDVAHGLVLLYGIGTKALLGIDRRPADLAVVRLQSLAHVGAS